MKIETFVLPGHASSSLHHRSDETGLEEGMLLSLYVQARCYFGFVKNLIDKQSQKEDLISTVRNQSKIGFKFSTLAKLKVLQISQLRHVLLLLSNLISCLKDLNWWRLVCSKHTIAIQKKTSKISIFAQKPKNPLIGSYVSLTLLHWVNEKHDFISGRGPLIYYEQWETRIMIFLNFDFIRF